MKKIVKKADIILFAILVLGSGLLFTLSFIGSSDGAQVVIRSEGKLYGTYNLHEDQTIEVENGNHMNKIIIKDGKVQMSEASCHNQLCVNQGSISKGNQAIVCLPNRVVVEIIGGEEDYDVISG